MKTTSHADHRARKRIGVSDVSGMFQDALKEGLHQRDCKGQLKRHINNAAWQHKSSAVIYRGYVFWYKPHGEVLITVTALHQKWHKYLK